MGRAKPGRQRIKEALFGWLEHGSLKGINVVDLCTMAKVSRSTFYAYYSNVDDVYRELVSDLVLETSAMKPQLRCAGCGEDTAKEPLCALIRKGGKYHALANEERFLATFRDICMADHPEESLSLYTDVCSDMELAYALYCFQMMGCIGAARIVPDSADWDTIRHTLDTFIRGGLNSVRNSE